MIVSQYFNWFIIFSFVGWIYECIYCTVKSRHWSNRGFLFGPVCPIYGSGAVLAIIVFSNIHVEQASETPLWEIFLICMVGSAILEYVTSFVLEKKFHALWWDYSSVPLNLNGRICLPASIGFGVAGILVVKFLMPMTVNVSDVVPPILREIVSLGFMAVFAGDLVLTVSSLTELVSRVESMEEEFNVKLETAYQTVEEKRQVLDDFRQRREEKRLLKEEEKQMEQMERELSYMERLSSYAGQLNSFQKHALRSMNHFKSEKTSSMANRLKDSMEGLAAKAKELKNKKTDE